MTKAFVHDLAWLQIRLICESIALACLVVHEDIPLTQAKDMQKAYQADYILKKLGKLHADYFPRPVVEAPNPDYPGVFAFEDKRSGFLTQGNLIKLYSTSGDRLHRGSIKSIVTKTTTPFAAKSVAAPLSEIANLLGMHTIQPIDPQWIYLVRMSNAKDHVEIRGFEKNKEGGKVDVVRSIRI